MSFNLFIFRLNFLIISFVLICLIEKSKNNGIKKGVLFVYETFNFGAHSPNYTGDKDNFGYSWNGKMELTNVGKRQQYLLGRKIRDRYQNYLSSQYNENEISVTTLPSNSTIQSAFSQLQGIYYQSEANGQKLSENQKKTAYPPIKNISKAISDLIANLKDFALPAFSTVLPQHQLPVINQYYPSSNNICSNDIRNFPLNNNKQVAFDLAKDFYIKHKDFLNQLNLNYSEDIQFYYTLFLISEAFISNYYENNDLSNFGNKQTLDSMLRAFQDFKRKAYFDFINGKYNDNFYTKLQTTEYFKDLLNLFQRRIKMNNNNKDEGYNSTYPKLMLFSSEDSFIPEQMSLLGKAFSKDFSSNLLLYASNLIYELVYLDSVNLYYVNVLFNFDVILQLPFDQFSSLIKNNLLSNEKINEFCKFEKEVKPIKSSELKQIRLWRILMISLSIIAIILLFIIGYVICFVRKKIPSREIEERNVPEIN